MKPFKRKGSQYLYVKLKVGIDEKGRSIWKNFSTKKKKVGEAKMVGLAMQAEFDKSLKKPKGDKLLVSELLEIYQSKTKRGKAAKTIQGEKTLRKTVNKYFGFLRLDEVTPEFIDDHIELRLSQVKKVVDGEPVYITPRTVRAELVLLQHAFNLASTVWRLIDFNPFKKVKLPKAQKVKKRYLEPEEQDLFIFNVEPQYRPIFIIAYDTGLRRRNINGLEWSHVDLGNRLLKIPETKNHESITVPMTERVFTSLSKIKKNPNVNLKWVFYNKETGDRFHVDTFSDIAARAAKKLKWPDVTFHTARHSFCSNLAINGANGKDIMDAAGHKDQKTSSDYTKINLERVRDTIKLLENPKRKTVGC